MEASFGGLSLADDGDEGLLFHIEPPKENTGEPSLCLVGRFVADRPIRVNIMKERLASIWRPVEQVLITEAESGLFLFQFYHPLDLEQVLQNGPWNFDNQLLLLGPLQIGVPLSEIELNHADFWVQAHNLPVGFMNEMVGKHLANYIGEFISYDKSNNTTIWRNYMRIRVRVDVRRPLKTERKVRRDGGEWSTVKFKYEKLTTLCFVCGLLGHLENRCRVRFAMKEDSGVRGWGVELRAENRRQPSSCRWLKSEGTSLNPSSSTASRADVAGQSQGPQHGPFAFSAQASVNAANFKEKHAHIPVTDSAIKPNIQSVSHQSKTATTDQINIHASSSKSSTPLVPPGFGRDSTALIPRTRAPKNTLPLHPKSHVADLQSTIPNYMPVPELLELDPPSTKKRQRSESSNSTVTTNNFLDSSMVQATSNTLNGHFLLAGPGNQVCQDK